MIPQNNVFVLNDIMMPWSWTKKIEEEIHRWRTTRIRCGFPMWFWAHGPYLAQEWPWKAMEVGPSLISLATQQLLCSAHRLRSRLQLLLPRILRVGDSWQSGRVYKSNTPNKISSSSNHIITSTHSLQVTSFNLSIERRSASDTFGCKVTDIASERARRSIAADWSPSSCVSAPQNFWAHS